MSSQLELLHKKNLTETAIRDVYNDDFLVETQLDGANNIYAEIAIDGRIARGPWRLVFDAILYAQYRNISILEAFETRRIMFVDINPSSEPPQS